MALVPASQQQQQYPIVAGYALKTGFTIAAFGPSVILTNAAPGIYRFSVSAIITTAEAAHTVTVNAICTDDQQAETVAVISAASTAAQGQFNGVQVLENTATANISWSIATTDVGTGVGNFYVLVERLF